MRKRTTRLLTGLLSFILLCSILAISVFAGSPKTEFSFNFSFLGSMTQCSGQKTDAGTSTGNHSDLYITTYNHNALFVVFFWLN